MPATLRLTRDQSIPVELRRGRFDVFVDGERVGSIENHENFEVQVEPGRHTLGLRKGRYSSQEVSFDVGDGHTVSFRCHGAMIWPTWLLSLVVPTMAISLRQQ